jgi:hypothetical protein
MVVYYQMKRRLAHMSLIETLFSENIVRMGPSRVDPARQVATFDPDVAGRLATLRASAMDTFRWLAGEWSYENPVPATRLSPAYCDAGSATFAVSSDGSAMCMVRPGDAEGASGRHVPFLVFDPWSRRWMYMLTQGSYCTLRSPGWDGNRIVFTGAMTMIGIDCEWRMTWTRRGDDEFTFVNEERLADGSWAYIDEWRYVRKSQREGN